MNLILMFFMQQGDGMTGLVSSLLPFLLIILVFYFLILRPQQKRQKERQKLLESIKKGDKVITSGGVHGTVEGIEEKTVLVKIAENTKVKVDRSAITAIVGLTPEVK
jgi:preprotein translocase subunit YajC